MKKIKKKKEKEEKRKEKIREAVSKVTINLLEPSIQSFLFC